MNHFQRITNILGLAGLRIQRGFRTLWARAVLRWNFQKKPALNKKADMDAGDSCPKGLASRRRQAISDKLCEPLRAMEMVWICPYRSQYDSDSFYDKYDFDRMEWYVASLQPVHACHAAVRGGYVSDTDKTKRAGYRSGMLTCRSRRCLSCLSAEMLSLLWNHLWIVESAVKCGFILDYPGRTLFWCGSELEWF